MSRASANHHSSSSVSGTDGSHVPADTAEQLAGAARSGIERGREAAATKAETLAAAASDVAERLAPQSQSLANYSERLSQAAARTADRLRTSSLDQLLSDAQGAAKEHTGLFLAGSFLAGIAVARFMKASSERLPAPMRPSEVAEGDSNVGSAPASGSYEPSVPDTATSYGQDASAASTPLMPASTVSGTTGSGSSDSPRTVDTASEKES